MVYVPEGGAGDEKPEVEAGGEESAGDTGRREGWVKERERPTLVLDDYPSDADGGVGRHLLGAEAAALEALLAELGGAVCTGECVDAARAGEGFTHPRA